MHYYDEPTFLYRGESIGLVILLRRMTLALG